MPAACPAGSTRRPSRGSSPRSPVHRALRRPRGDRRRADGPLRPGGPAPIGSGRRRRHRRVAGGPTFAAFPEWYASLFSGFYLPLLLILVALILRGVAFEFRGKIDSDRRRRNWDRAIIVGSFVPALLWGVAFANMVQGVPLHADHEFTGTLLTLLNPYALLGGLATVLLFLLHGAVFLALKTTGDVQVRTAGLARGAGVAAIVAALALVAGIGAAGMGREGWAFLFTAVAVIAVTVTLFGSLYPDVLPSTTDPAYSLTTTNAASTPDTLKIMTWVAAVFTPVVLAYQAWTFWGFRRRIGRSDIPPAAGLPPRRQPATSGRP
ncbi:cytochrome d ubiquinol oxidase subunit II [Pseudonocardia asaccharolytica]|uniref:cytochrome d ubiquinol oxidase subunit II n=1 Tax=Pseudonocardia asaccharolytica TaxID=54010 RepID=UPI000A022D06|nr:cytochrome d ubiquinol oxidase subunit II [Pseudonocardia asaccharolytica]